MDHDSEEAFQRIDAWYPQMLTAIGVENYQGKIARVRSDDGFSHLERIGEEWHWIATERGNENARQVFKDDEGLKYQLASEAVGAVALQYELANRIDGQDFRRIYFAHRLRLMGLVSSQWQKRLHAELERILAEHPFHDALPDTQVIRIEKASEADAKIPGEAFPANQNRVQKLVGKLVLFLVLLAPLALIWWHYAVISDWRLFQALDDRGVNAVATITYTTVGDAGGYKDFSDRIEYAYDVDGVQFNGSDRIMDGEMRYVSEGDLIAVRYLPENPSEAQLAATPPIFDILNLILLDVVLIIATILGYRRIRAELADGAS